MKFKSFIKDITNAAKRIATGPKALEQFSETEIDKIYEKMKAYEPKTENGKLARANAIRVLEDKLGVTQRLSEAQEQATKELEATFDAMVIGQKVMESCSLLEVHIHKPGFDKVVNTKVTFDKIKKSVNPDYDPDAEDGDKKLDFNSIAVVQRTIDRKFQQPLITQRNEFWAWLKNRSIPSSAFSHGRFLIPRTLILAAQQRIERFRHERELLIDEFEKKYDEAKKDAKKRLGDQFNEALYPPFEYIRARYGVTHRWRSYDVDAHLSEVSEELHREEAEKARAEWADTAIELRDVLRSEMVNLVEHFADRLGKDEETGKPKTFYGTRLTRLVEFLDTFADRNLTNDDELASIAKKAKALVDGVDVKQIRKSESLRSALETGFNKIKEEAAKMVIVRGRKFNLADDDE